MALKLNQMASVPNPVRTSAMAMPDAPRYLRSRSRLARVMLQSAERKQSLDGD